MPVIWCEFNESRDIIASDRTGDRVIVVPSGVASRAEFMGVIGADRDVPSYFGKNWDALVDIVGELGGVRIVVEAPDRLDRSVWNMLVRLADDVVANGLVVYAVVRPDDVGDSSPAGD